MFAYAAATLLLWIIAARVDHMNSGAEELEMVDPAKPPVSGNVVVEKVSEVEYKVGVRYKNAKNAVHLAYYISQSNTLLQSCCSHAGWPGGQEHKALGASGTYGR